MGKTKITVTLEETLVEALARFSEQRAQSRSQIVEEAVRSWERRQIEQELIEGYQAMAQEDLERAEIHFPAGLEALK